jgi:outer membrane protein assembly factor BamB
LFICLSAASYADHYDWPAWRYDHNRSAATPEKLTAQLYPQWQVKYSPRIPVWDDPLNQDMMQFDRIFEPIVAGGRIFLGFNDQDKVIALDINTGKELWHFYADGPVRLPMAANKGRIYFTGDDGFCYCLDQETGFLIWKFLLAPGSNKMLGNKRLISMWPARGGIVIRDDIIYTAASIFPMMGTYIYAIDAETGRIIWKNEGTGSNYILQPHSSPAFADVAPQGSFTISGDVLLVAGGRSVPAAFDLKTGEQLYYQLAASGKTGGAFTCSNDRVFFNHHRDRMTYMYNSGTGNRIRASTGCYPVVDGDTIYFSGNNITAALLNSENNLETLWTIDVPASGDLIKAGNILYSADPDGINAVRLNRGGKPELLWHYPSDRNIQRLVASNGKLIAVSDDGTIQVFGETQPVKTLNLNRSRKPARSLLPGAGRIIRTSQTGEGYAFLLGSVRKGLLKRMISKTSLHIIVYGKSRTEIDYLRAWFDEKGVKADRLCFLCFDEDTYSSLPKYFSSLTIITDKSFIKDLDADKLKQLYESVRPYDGRIWVRAARKERALLFEAAEKAGIQGAQMKRGLHYAMISRTEALEGSSPWTHNNGDIANTLKSDDDLVKAPLGILWFGGNSNTDVLPRHGHGPGEQVVDGRLIIEGISSISARDVYTGRVLWKREFEKLMDDSWLVYYDESYDEENPLDTKYNQVHLPGANARGTNFIATREYVYLIEGNNCKLIDIRTGALKKVFSTGDNETRELGYIGVYEDLLILGSNFAEFPGLEGDSLIIKNPKFTDYNITASKELIVMNRFTGKRLWSIPANHGFIHNSVIAGDDRLFCLDKLPQYLETRNRRRGEIQPEGSRMLCLDIRSGDKLFEMEEDIFGTWLGYSSVHKLLLQATRPSRDMLNGEEGNRMIAYNAVTMEKNWDKNIRYANPPIIHNDRIYTNGEGFSLLSGDPLVENDPITGEELKWNFKREYGCGIVAASEHLLTFRSASAGFVNLGLFEGTASLGGWKPGCSTNLIAADGVLNSPDYTRTCQCPYQNQTSLALIHMPWMSYWTNSNYIWNGKQIRKLGLNFNAPGDRSSNENILWLEYPVVGGASPEIPVKMDTVNYSRIRKEPISVISENTPWVSASAIGGIRSIEIALSADNRIPESTYKVNLYFSELEDKGVGERIFNIGLQGKIMLENLDIASEAGKCDKEIVKSFSGIKAGRSLKIDLTPVKGNTIISGVEIIMEG